MIPSYSRNVYDHAVRMTGVKIVELKEPSELPTIFNERTATQISGQRLVDSVVLIKALGGGWEQTKTP